MELILQIGKKTSVPPDNCLPALMKLLKNVTFMGARGVGISLTVTSMTGFWCFQKMRKNAVIRFTTCPYIALKLFVNH